MDKSTYHNAGQRFLSNIVTAVSLVPSPWHKVGTQWMLESLNVLSVSKHQIAENSNSSPVNKSASKWRSCQCESGYQSEEVLWKVTFQLLLKTTATPPVQNVCPCIQTKPAVRRVKQHPVRVGRLEPWLSTAASPYNSTLLHLTTTSGMDKGCEPPGSALCLLLTSQETMPSLSWTISASSGTRLEQEQGWHLGREVQRCLWPATWPRATCGPKFPQM